MDEVGPLLAGGRLENVFPAGAETVVLAFYAQRQRRHLLVSVSPSFARLHLVADRPRGTRELPHFVRVVRQGLRGRRLEAVGLLGGDRVVELRFGQRGETAGSLVAELTGRSSNLYYLGPQGKLVAALRRPPRAERARRPGARYHPPEPGPEPAAATRDRFAGQASYSAAIERHYSEAEAQRELTSRRSALASSLKARRKRTARLVDKLRADLRGCEDIETLRLKGELLKINLHSVPPRAERVVVENVFSESGQETVIELDRRLSPRGNLERYFRRYKKLAAARERGQARLAEALARLDELDRLTLAVQAAASLDELAALASRVGYRPRGTGPRRRAGPLRFTSADGYEILVARTARENDELTFHIARGNDLWLHVEGYTGSHVVVRLPRSKSCPKETLLDAATLAVFYSQLRRSGGGPVAYCARKHVVKPRGGGPGEALYSQSKTLHVEVEEERLRRLMGEGPR